MTEDSETVEAPKAGSAWITVVVCLLLAGVAALLLWWIFSTQPKAERTTETRRSPMLVRVDTVERGTFRPRIVALGRVETPRDIILSPRVGGRIIERAPEFSPGGFLPEGAVIARIDPADYEAALQQRESDLKQARADLEIEMGRQKVAESDLDLLDEALPDRNRDLVLRQPQLDTAEARVASAQAAVDLATLNLERTAITVPFDAQVLERRIDVGSEVSAGDELGRLVGTGTYWVVTTVRLSSLPWIDVTARGADGSAVTLRNRSVWPKGETRPGSVAQLIGTLDEDTRLARLLVTVDDPLALDPAHAGQPALILGAILEAEITGREITDVIRLPRAHLRENDTVWIMTEDDTLRIAEVEVVFRDVEFAYIRTGLEDNDRVVTTNLATVTEGAPLQRQEETE